MLASHRRHMLRSRPIGLLVLLALNSVYAIGLGIGSVVSFLNLRLPSRWDAHDNRLRLYEHLGVFFAFLMAVICAVAAVGLGTARPWSRIAAFLGWPVVFLLQNVQMFLVWYVVAVDASTASLLIGGAASWWYLYRRRSVVEWYVTGERLPNPSA